MKKITLLLIALLTSGTMLMAQGGPRGGQRNMDPKDRAERMTERMVKEYSLSDAQKKQLYDVNLAMAEKMNSSQKADDSKEADKTARKNKKEKSAKQGKSDNNSPSKEDREAMRDEMKKSREDYNAKIEKIFTKKQYETYIKNQEERQNRMGERGPRP